MPEQIPLNSHEQSAAGVGSSLAGQGGYSRALTLRENLGSAKTHHSPTPCFLPGLLALIPQQNHQNPAWKTLRSSVLSHPMAAPWLPFPCHKKIQGQIHKQHPNPPVKLPLIYVTEDPPTSQTRIKAFLGEALCLPTSKKGF